nr:MAG TPA: High frequency of lysogenization C protein [Caudoviricetes sp.]
MENTTLDAGFHLKAPWQNVVTIDNRVQKDSRTTSAFSSDIQQVDITYSVNFSIDKATAMDLYRTVGVNYYQTIILPRLEENVKSVFSHYTADALVSKRSELSSAIEQRIRDDMNSRGINIVSVNIENIDFTDAYTDAVEAKQVAAQKKLQAETEQAQQTMEAKAKAERDKISAQTEADIIKIQADSKRYATEQEAEGNKRLADSLTTVLVQYYQAMQWDGALPKTILSESSVPILDVSQEQ